MTTTEPITTAEEIDALPAGSIVLCPKYPRMPYVKKSDGTWNGADSDTREFDSGMLTGRGMAPHGMLLLYRPDRPVGVVGAEQVEAGKALAFRLETARDNIESDHEVVLEMTTALREYRTQIAAFGLGVSE